MAFAKKTTSKCNVSVKKSSRDGAVTFRSEEDLVDSIQSVFDDGSSKQWAWVKELSSPAGIADLVAVELAKDWRRNRSLSEIPARWLYALKRLPFEPVSSTSFSGKHGVSRATASAILSAYTQAGYCEFSSPDRVWIKRRDPSPIVQRIVALEAKLRDWRRALYQAVQYASFASESWVVMDKNRLHSAMANIDEFERRGIGLLALSKTGDVEILNTPSTRVPRMPERFWHVNAEILKRLI